jgi:hypothetical protein
MAHIYGRKKRMCILKCLVSYNASFIKYLGHNSFQEVENNMENALQK